MLLWNSWIEAHAKVELVGYPDTVDPFSFYLVPAIDSIPNQVVEPFIGYPSPTPLASLPF